MPFSGLMFALTIEGQGTGPTGSEQMGQADAFETDFWKHANLRKAWDDIVPGEPRKTIPYTLTREAIALYCRAVGDDHPIYFDEAYARTTRYGGLRLPPSPPHPLPIACTRAVAACGHPRPAKPAQ